MTKVLVVDDEKSIRVTFQNFLSREGYIVLAAENFDSACALLREHDIDLVITDIIMPRVSGIELLKSIKEINPDIPVVIMTGEPTVDTAQQSVNINAFDYLTKPINKEQLLSTAYRAAAYKKLLDKKKELEKENSEYRLHLENLVSIRTKALNDTIRATISMIASLVEMRDPYTAGHQRKVANLAVAMGSKMKLPVNTINCLYIAGYLHDIGKIAVPAEILSKPGRLTNIEFEMIKAHVAYGYDILSKVALPCSVAEIIYQHHERMDKSGYPNGLEGSSIRLEAKILAIADVIEAMNAHRPYRPSHGLTAALDEIKINSGKLYDPQAAAAAVELFEKDKYELNDEQHLNIDMGLSENNQS